MSKLLLAPAILIAVLVLAPSSYACCDTVFRSQALCPGGCTVDIIVFSPNCEVGDQCYSNEGEQISCPDEQGGNNCAGEFVFTASPTGVCDPENQSCEDGLIKRERSGLREGRFAKVYALDCDGSARVLLANSRLHEMRAVRSSKSGPASDGGTRPAKFGSS